MIIYNVNGKTNINSKKGINLKSKKNIAHNSSGNISKTGIQNGESYGSAKKINVEDLPTDTKNLKISVFFDGTLNNKTNVETGGDKSLSYENDYSNVVRGWDVLDKRADEVKVYVEGIGTVDEEKDSTVIGAGMGVSGTGVKAKVTKGCILAVDAIYKELSGKNIKINKLEINVFGFSRGSAAARHFIDVCSKYARTSENELGYLEVLPPTIYSYAKDENKTDQVLSFKTNVSTDLFRYGYLGALLTKKKIKLNKIVFNFTGLYDTVASYGLIHSNDTSNLGLNAIAKSNFTFQLASDHEMRKNFPLTNIDSSGLKGLQVILPGVHSDIGGGYKSKKEEAKLLQENSLSEINKFKDLLKEEGWFNEEELKIEEKGLIKKLHKYYRLSGIRSVVSKNYSGIPLSFMFDQSEKYGVSYDRSLIQISYGLSSNEFLSRLKGDLENYINACIAIRQRALQSKDLNGYKSNLSKIHYSSYVKEEDLKKLKNGYLHWSSSAWDSISKLDLNINIVNQPNTTGAVKESLRNREVYPG